MRTGKYGGTLRGPSISAFRGRPTRSEGIGHALEHAVAIYVGPCQNQGRLLPVRCASSLDWLSSC